MVMLWTVQKLVVNHFVRDTRWYVVNSSNLLVEFSCFYVKNVIFFCWFLYFIEYELFLTTIFVCFLGDLFVDGKVIHRPQFRFSERQQTRNRPRPRYDRRRETMQVERREPVQRGSWTHENQGVPGDKPENWATKVLSFNWYRASNVDVFCFDTAFKSVSIYQPMLSFLMT